MASPHDDDEIDARAHEETWANMMRLQTEGVYPVSFAAIKAPILMIHGEADDNTGTFPIQSERMFQAIKGLGGTARLVMLPNESHAYRARESILMP